MSTGEIHIKKYKQFVSKSIIKINLLFEIKRAKVRFWGEKVNLFFRFRIYKNIWLYSWGSSDIWLLIFEGLQDTELTFTAASGSTSELKTSRVWPNYTFLMRLLL